MIDPNAAREKYASRAAVLRVPPTANETMSPEAVAEAILAAAGDLLRRSRTVTAEAAQIDAALRKVDRQCVVRWLAAIDVEALGNNLRRIPDEALEARFSESEVEAEAWAALAVDGFGLRDRLESALHALRRWESLQGALSGQVAELRQKLTTELEALDRSLKAKIRRMLAANGERRLERDLLDPEHRAAAWWFSLRADCDALFGWLGGEKVDGDAHVNDCPDCRNDLEASGRFELPRVRHLTADQLWRYDLGVMPAAERCVAEHHASRCPPCAQAIHALRDADQLIAELTGKPLSPMARERGEREQVRARAPNRAEVVHEDDTFNVVLLRTRQRLKLRVEPRNKGFAAAAVYLPGDAVPKPKKSGKAVEFDLGKPEDLSGVTLKVEVEGKGGGKRRVSVKL